MVCGVAPVHKSNIFLLTIVHVIPVHVHVNTTCSCCNTQPQPCFRNLSFYFTSGLKLSSSHTRAATAYTHRHEGKGESVQSLVWQRVNSDGLEMLRLSLLSGTFGHKKLLIIYDEEQVSKSQLSEAHRMRVHVHVPVIAKRNTRARRLSYHHHRFILAKCQLSTCNTMLSGFPYSSDFPKNCELPLI